MEFNSWGTKIGEIKTYQPREQKFASFGNINRYVNQDSSGAASGILASNKGFAKQVMQGIDSGKIKLKTVGSGGEFEFSGQGKPVKITEQGSLSTNINPRPMEKLPTKGGFKGMLGSIGGFFKKGFGF